MFINLHQLNGRQCSFVRKKATTFLAYMHPDIEGCYLLYVLSGPYLVTLVFYFIDFYNIIFILHVSISMPFDLRKACFCVVICVLLYRDMCPFAL